MFFDGEEIKDLPLRTEIVTGPAGPTGNAGQDGVGVISGGTIGQVLAKKTDNDYDTEWIDQTQIYAVTWGAITGTLTNQTDLQDALNLKAPSTGIPVSSITGLATVATSGSYNDLSDKPTIGTGTITSIIAGTGLLGGTITTSGTIAVSYGTITGTSVQGNDTRVVNAVQKTGDSMTGKLIAAADATISKLNVGNALSPSANPTTTTDGDIWINNGSRLTYKSNASIYNLAPVNTPNTFTSVQVIDVTSNTNPALRVTQKGSGEAFRVEDESPDTTPFVISNSGHVGIGVAPDAAIGLSVDASGIKFGNGTIQTTAFAITASGDLSGNYPNPNVVKLQGYSVSATSPANGQILQWGGESWLPASIPQGGSGGGGISYFLNFNESAIGAITGLPTSPNSPKRLSREGTITQSSYTSAHLSKVNYDLIAGFVSDPLDPNVTQIPAGLWDFNIWASSDANNLNQTLMRLFVYKYNGSTTTLLAESDDIFIYDPTVAAQYIASVVFPSTAILETDRIYIELRGKAATNNRTITISFGGATPSHVHTTLPSVAGTGVVKVVNGVFQTPANLIFDADVDASAAISQGKIVNLTTDLAGKLGLATGSCIIAKSGDDLLSKYAEAKALTPNGSSLSSINRANLIILPSSYTLSSELAIDAEFVDVIGLGAQTQRPAVVITGNTLNVSANNVRVSGISVGTQAFKISTNKPLQVFENCVGGDNSFGKYDDTASGTFTNCVGATDCFAGNGGIANGTFTNCTGGLDSFGGEGTTNGIFINCTITVGTFNVLSAPASGTARMINCIDANGDLINGQQPL
jgi:hypothetical protein